jgi:hypothetical protein
MNPPTQFQAAIVFFLKTPKFYLPNANESLLETTAKYFVSGFRIGSDFAANTEFSSDLSVLKLSCFSTIAFKFVKQMYLPLHYWS